MSHELMIWYLFQTNITLEEYNLMYNIYQQSRRQTETITELRKIRDETDSRPLLETAFLVKPNGNF